VQSNRDWAPMPSGAAWKSCAGTRVEQRQVQQPSNLRLKLPLGPARPVHNAVVSVSIASAASRVSVMAATIYAAARLLACHRLLLPRTAPKPDHSGARFDRAGRTIPMIERVLITGGAGFIGSHLADELLRQGHRVRALDCLSPQVHGSDPRRPDYLDPEVELVVGDVRDRATLRSALRDVDAVVHLAAKVGVGQSMYQIVDYTSVNNEGTATLLEALIDRPVQRLVVASSMSIYGEGLYRDADGRLVAGADRPREQLERHEWELSDRRGGRLEPVPTPESKPPALTSIYALSKYDQERMCLLAGQAYRIPTVALRFFNVYGPRQALGNPYTGVLAIFAARLLNRKSPLIFEDGHQQRDFVNVRDIAQACRLALTEPGAPGHAFNIGGGRSFTVREIAARMAAVMNCEDITPEIAGRYRVGDIRHCFADITLARERLSYEPQVTLEDGLQELSAWLEGQVAVDRADEARRELALRGLTV
jgi:dTDP-L-rhamnose 4-epimerase